MGLTDIALTVTENWFHYLWNLIAFKALQKNLFGQLSLVQPSILFTEGFD
jgi:hypothetical protein